MTREFTLLDPPIAPDRATAIVDKILARQGFARAERRTIIADVRADGATTTQPKDIAMNNTIDAKAAVDDLTTAFHQFTARYDGKVADAESRMNEIDKLVSRTGLGGTMQTDRADVREIANFYSAARRRDVSTEEVAGADLRGYASAMRQYLRVGENGLPADIKAAMSVGSDPDGGYWIPPLMSADIKTKLFETSPMRSVASVMTITTDSIKFPVSANDLTSGGWVAETASRAVTATPQIGEQTIYVHEQYASPSVTQKLLDMSSIDVESWLTGKIVDRLGRSESTGFVTGTGVGQPRGFLDYASAAVTTADATRSWGVLQYVASGASGAFPTLSGIPGAADADALVNTQMALKPIYRAAATWMMNRSTAGTVRKMKDGDGRFLWTDALTQGQPALLLGSPVVLAEDMPDIAANSYSIAYGDFGRGYQIIDGPSLRVLRDPFTAKPYVIFYATKWTGGDVVDTDAIKLMKMSSS